MSVGDVVAIAEKMVAAFGNQAGAIMEARIHGHIRAGDDAGAEFWGRIAAAVRVLDNRTLLPFEPSAGDAP